MNMIKTIYWMSIAVSVLMVITFEAGILEPGCGAGDVETQFIVVSLLELATVCAVPLAIRLFRFRRVRDEIKAGHYLRWALARLFMLAAPLVANTLLYYIYMNVAFGYMAIILLISMVFIYPSGSRVNRETSIE